MQLDVHNDFACCISGPRFPGPPGMRPALHNGMYMYDITLACWASLFGLSYAVYIITHCFV